MRIRPRIRLSARFLAMSIVVLLTIMSYGAFYDRGPCNDDFINANKVAGHSFYDMTYNWSIKRDSRLTQVVTMPLMYHLFSADSFLNYHWDYFHLTGLLLHVGNIILIYLILSIFDLPLFMRTCVALLFAIHPIKNETILWPVDIMGYVVPFFIFLMCTYVYFLLAKKQYRRDGLYSLLIFVIWFIPVFAVEQILPIIPVVMAVRYLTFPFRKKHLLLQGICIVILTASFVLITFSGGTAEKVVSETGGKGLYFDLQNVYSSMSSLFDRIVRLHWYPPFSYDSTKLIKSIFSCSTTPLLFGVAVLAAILCVVLLNKNRPPESGSANNIKKCFGVLLSGVLITILPLTPLLLVRFGIPGRTTYIPLIGISLIIAALLSCSGELLHSLFDKKKYKALRTPLFLVGVCLFILFVVGCSLINFTQQNAHSKSWEIKKHVLSTVKEMFPTVPLDAKFYIFGLPRRIGPSEVFNNYGITSAFNLLYPNKRVRASVTKPIISLLNNHEQAPNQEAKSVIPFAWHENRLHTINRIIFRANGLDNTSMNEIKFPLLTQRYSEHQLTLNCLTKEIPLNASASGIYQIRGITLYYFPEINKMELLAELKQERSTGQKHTMLFDVFHKDVESNITKISDNQKIPVSVPRHNEKTLRLNFVIENARQIETIRIGICPKGMYWNKLEIDLKAHQEIIRIKDNAIELSISDLREFLELG